MWLWLSAHPFVCKYHEQFTIIDLAGSHGNHRFNENTPSNRSNNGILNRSHNLILRQKNGQIHTSWALNTVDAVHIRFCQNVYVSSIFSNFSKCPNSRGLLFLYRNTQVESMIGSVLLHLITISHWLCCLLDGQIKRATSDPSRHICLIRFHVTENEKSFLRQNEHVSV